MYPIRKESLNQVGASPVTLKAWAIIRSELKGLVLDVGCGNGQVTYTHSHVIGIDMPAAESKIPTTVANMKIPLILGDMHCLPFRASAFKTMVFNHSLEHTSSPELTLAEAHRVLKDDGKIVINSPNVRYFLWPLFWARHGYAFGKDHKSFFTFASLRSLLERNGFTVVKTFSVYLPITNECSAPVRILLGAPFVSRAIEKVAGWLSNLHPIFSIDVGVVACKDPNRARKQCQV